jgi:hypothetical protein
VFGYPAQERVCLEVRTGMKRIDCRMNKETLKTIEGVQIGNKYLTI